MSDNVNAYPYNSSHYRSWIAKSKNDYQLIQQKLNEKKWAIGLINIPPELQDSIKQKITPFVVESTINWVIRTSLTIWHAKQLDFRLQNTALTLFKRFFLRKTIIDVAPQLVIMTCLIVAIKIENSVVENRSADALFSQSELQHFQDVLELESTLISVIQYDFHIIHGDSIVNYLISHYLSFRKKRCDYSVPSFFNSNMRPQMNLIFSFTDNTNNEIRSVDQQQNLLRKWLEFSNSQIQSFYLMIHVSSIHFYHTPSIIAHSIFAFYLETICDCSDVMDFFIDSAFSQELKSNKVLMDSTLNTITTLKGELANIYMNQKDWRAENVKSTISTVMKVLKKLGRIKTKKQVANTDEAEQKKFKSSEHS